MDFPQHQHLPVIRREGLQGRLDLLAQLPLLSLLLGKGAVSGRSRFSSWSLKEGPAAVRCRPSRRSRSTQALETRR